MASPTKPQLVAVQWHDAHSSLDEVRAEDAPQAAIVVTTTGWLLRETPAGVAIGGEQITHADGDITYRATSFIPAALVLNVEPLTPKRRRKASTAPPPPSDP